MSRVGGVCGFPLETKSHTVSSLALLDGVAYPISQRQGRVGWRCTRGKVAVDK